MTQEKIISVSEWAELQAQLRKRDRYLAGVVEMQLRLLATEADHLGALNDALAPLGEASGADRIYIFENNGVNGHFNGLTSQKAEWCAPGVAPQINNPALQNIRLEDFFPRWMQALEAGEQLVCLESTFDEHEREYLGPQGIKSLLVLPLMIEEELTGFIGFDNCQAEVAWTQSEVQLLQAAASQISLNLAQRRARRDLLELNASLERRVTERTHELATKNASLAEALATLKRTQQELIQAEKLSGLGRMVAGVAHELRNPINYIGNNLLLVIDQLQRLRKGLEELIDPEDPDNQEVVDWLGAEFREMGGLLGFGHQGVERIGEIVESLVNFARLDEVERKYFDLDSTITDTVRILRPKWSKLPPIQVTGETGIQIDGHRVNISQVIMNLLDNALYAAVERHGQEQAQVSLAISRGETCVEIRVQDNGSGIPPEIHDQLFDPFVTSKPVGTGTGLGLSISWSIAQQHDGRLILEKTGPEGTVFCLKLPRIDLEKHSS